MRQLLILALIFSGAVTTGCLTRYRQAHELAKAGKFVEAAELFEQLAKESPNDPELPELMNHARYRAVEHALGRARQYRLAEDPLTSERHFADGLSLRKRWNLKLNGALEGTIDDEREDATARLRAQVLPRASKGEALVAESILEDMGFLLQHEELAALRDELTRATLTSGESTCAKLRPSAVAGEPYWTHVVAQYCKHFRSAAPVEPVLADTFSAAQSTLQISAMSDGASGVLKGKLEARLRESPWYSDKGPLVATLVTKGQAPVTRREEWTRQSAQWTERVPYTENVTKKLEETVPVNECETYEESAPGAPNGKVTRMRTVKKDKTQTREVVVAETRYRDVPRVFEYQALRVERTTAFSVRAELSVNGQPAATAGRDATETRHGYQHDVTFDPANVHPTRPEFFPAEAWFDANVNELAGGFAEAMREGWRARFCRGRSYSPDEAARCARAGDKVPQEAISALAPRLGEDAAQIPQLLAPPSLRRKPAAPPLPAPPPAK